jgi:hypothetical protein
VKLQHGETIINKSTGSDEYARGSRAEAGPEFKRVYKEFGPANPGEFLGEDGKLGVYCISFKEGIAFLFPVDAPEGFSRRDLARQIAVLDSTSCKPATSMVIFQGRSWPLARKDIYTADMSHLLLSPVTTGRREGVPAEIDMARVHDRGHIEFIRRDASPFILQLGETTQQDLLTELGPPDSMFKQDRSKANNHKRRTSSISSRRSGINLEGDRHSSTTSETDGSDAWSDEDDELEETTVINELDQEDVGIWWNYYSHGLDVLIAQAHQLPTHSPTALISTDESKENQTIARNHLTITKVCIHSNVPGSWQFNRHRRLRWALESWPLHEENSEPSAPLTSETKFRDIQTHLRTVFQEMYASKLEESEQQQPQAFNRDWGENSSLGNSVELLGGFEDSRKKGSPEGGDSEYGRLGEVLVYGFPGLAFEVLKNGVVAWLQVW